MTKQTIEQELVAATGTKPGKDRAKFLTTIHAAVMKLDDEDWNKLSDPAQRWANGGTKSIEADEALSDFPDVKKAPAVEAEEPEEEPVAEKKATTKTAVKPAAKPAAKPAPKEAKAEAKAEKPAKAEKAPAKKKAPGRIELMKGVMLKNMTAKPDDLKAKLAAVGIEVADATVTTVRSDFLSTLRVLKKAGKLTEDLAAKLPD